MFDKISEILIKKDVIYIIIGAITGSVITILSSELVRKYKIWRKRKVLLEILKLETEEVKKIVESENSASPPTIIIETLLNGNILDPIKDDELIRKLINQHSYVKDYNSSILHLGDGLEDIVKIKADEIINYLDEKY